MTKHQMTIMRFNDKLRCHRESKGFPQKQLAHLLNIDTPMYSRIERGERKAKREQVLVLADYFNDSSLINLWVADKVIDVIANESNPLEVLSIASESFEEYGSH